MHLGSAPRIPCPLRRFVPALFSCCRRRLCYLGLPMSTGDTLHYYSGIHTPALRCQLLSSPLCAFLGFLLLRLYVRMSTKPSKCGDLHGRRSFEAARNDAALASVSFVAEAYSCRLSPPTYCRAALVPSAVSFLHVFLRSGSSVMAFVKNMITLRGVTSHRLSRL
jgi:hypothetical protein